MKKLMIVVIGMLLVAAVAMAQNPVYTQVNGVQPVGIQGIDKLGAHQNGGRGCVGCHAPHSGSRGNGGSLTLASTWDNGTKTWSNVATPPATETRGDDALWGQDVGPILGMTLVTGGGSYPVSFANAESTQPRILTGVAFCLSCHDGNLAKGAMMTNASFEQAAGLLPPTYGSNTIPTLLGDDGGPAGNYANDHPIGQAATVSSLGSTSVSRYVDLDAAQPAATKLVLKSSQPDTKYTTFQANYGLPIINTRAGAGWVVDSTVATAGAAYVVCTTCHTPHTMYTATASATNPIAGLTSGTFPTYFFIAAPYNPAANTYNGTAASSATQFCRQCHFTGAGGSNESAGISIPTSF